MNRCILCSAVALLTFGIGVSVRLSLSHDKAEAYSPAPLLIHVSPVGESAGGAASDGEYKIYEVRVENVSGKTVRGYSLFYENSYGRGFMARCSSCEEQILLPGESKVRVTEGFRGMPRFWIDEVRFAGE
jgi:hypothetical protein